MAGQAGGGDLVTEPAPDRAPARRRAAFAAGLAVALAIVVAIVLAGGSGDDEAGEALAGVPAECIDAWNEDPVAMETGGHGARLHGASRAWVVYIGPDNRPSDETDGRCALVLPGGAGLEPELGVTVLEEKGWEALYSDDPAIQEAIAFLQAEAAQRTNAALSQEGQLLAD